MEQICHYEYSQSLGSNDSIPTLKGFFLFL